MKKPMVILTGPTAVGKTALSLHLAKDIDGEIVSADSMQVYQGMDIGTAKIRPEEMEGIPHHLINCFPPDHAFNVSEFHDLASKAADEICARGRIPIVTGGTGFYIQALLYDVSFGNEDKEDGYREKLEKISETEEGKQTLWKKLTEVDPDSSHVIHPHNVKKVIRALEYYHYHKAPISVHNEQERQKESRYNAACFVLTMNREKLYQRIDDRVDQMIQDGLVEEVQGLLQSGVPRNAISMQGIGYKETAAFLAGELSREEMIDEIKKNTRHFAKRQLTWFRREKDVIWIEKEPETADAEIEGKILKIIHEKNLI